MRLFNNCSEVIEKFQKIRIQYFQKKRIITRGGYIYIKKSMAHKRKEIENYMYAYTVIGLYMYTFMGLA